MRPYKRCQDGASYPGAEPALHRSVVGDQLQPHALQITNQHVTLSQYYGMDIYLNDQTTYIVAAHQYSGRYLFFLFGLSLTNNMFVLTGGVFWESSLFSLSVKPWIRVFPPVTTTLP